MHSTIASQIPSDRRPISLRARHDLVCRRSEYQGEVCWIIKDPLAMKYVRLMPPEFAVLEALKSRQSFDDLKRIVEHKYPQRTVSLASLEHLVASLHRSGLLVSDSVGQATPLRTRRNKELKQKAIGLLSSLISLKLPGFDPERLLSFLYARTRWLFSTWFTAMVVVTCLAAVALVLSDLDRFMARMPEFQSFFAVDNLLLMGVVLIVTKTFHEFGHGLMCKHFGGECHSIGFMLLVLTPAMYCDTSDSWTMPNKWHRIAIGAGGMYLELFLAAVCTFVWWFTHPGLVHYLALNVMFVSSISTIVFNANPLLRYDGYYILADFLEIPNLAQKSKTALLSLLRVTCLGMKPIKSPTAPQRHRITFALYSVASFVYRWFVMIVIFWFLTEIFEPYGLAPVGHVLIAISLTGMVLVPLFKMFKFFSWPGRFRDVKTIRAGLTAVALAAFGYVFCYVPIRQHVDGSFVIRPAAAQQAFVTQPGTLVRQTVAPGQAISTGDVLVELENNDLELSLLAMEGELARLKTDLAGYELNRNVQLDSERLIVETRVMIDELNRQIEIKKSQREQLVLRAERDGVVIPPPNRVTMGGNSDELETWSGTPLDHASQGAWLERDTLVCMVAAENEFEAIVVVDQSDLRLIEEGQSVKMVLEQQRDAVVRAQVRFVSRDQLTAVPRELSQSNGGPIAVQPTATGGESPLLKLYEVRAAIDEPANVPLRSGFRGIVKIEVAPASLGQMTVRGLRNLLNFR